MGRKGSEQQASPAAITPAYAAAQLSATAPELTCMACRLPMLPELGRPWCRPPLAMPCSPMPRLAGIEAGRGASADGPSAEWVEQEAASGSGDREAQACKDSRSEWEQAGTAVQASLAPAMPKTACKCAGRHSSSMVVAVPHRSPMTAGSLTSRRRGCPAREACRPSARWAGPCPGPWGSARSAAGRSCCPGCHACLRDVGSGEGRCSQVLLRVYGLQGARYARLNRSHTHAQLAACAPAPPGMPM